MKRLMGEEMQTSAWYPDGPLFKERRKAYYHGKYSKRILSLLLLVSCAALIILSQSA
jgi:hypothetical protein